MASRLRLSSIALLSLAVSCVSGVSARAITIDWVAVGDAGNAADTDPAGYGAVADAFRIMKYEFTNQQYADFLNSVAATDTYSLYNPSMGTNARGGITRSGAPGGYAYAVKANMGDKPVNYVSWWDAARVANWLVNGSTASSNTETGAYTLVGGTDGTAPAVNAGAGYSLPSENQWYKAAFFKGGGPTAGYWDYATQSDTAPVGVTADSQGTGSAGGTGNFANFDFNADWNTFNGNVTTVATNGGPSAYDAFDLDGNVREWNDLTGAASLSRGIRGGSWDYPAASLSSSNRLLNPAEFESFSIGFRLASVAIVPEPSTWAIATGGLACAAWGAFRRRTRARRPRGSKTFLGLCPTAIVMAWVSVPVSAATQVFVQFPDNRQIGPLEVEPSDSIDSLKAKVEDRLGTPPDRQYLYSGNQLLLDGRTFSDYTVPNGSTLPLVATWSFGLSSPTLLATWAFGISDVTTGAGTGWTRWSSSSVDFTGSGTGAFVLDVHGYAGSVAGPPAGYDPQAAYDWPFLEAQGITGFSAAMFSVTGDFTSRASVVQDGTNLVLHVAPVPEPSPCIIGLAGLAGLAGGGRSFRRRRGSKTKHAFVMKTREIVLCPDDRGAPRSSAHSNIVETLQAR